MAPLGQSGRGIYFFTFAGGSVADGGLMATIDFDIECGICGENIHAEPDFNAFGMTLVVTCSGCKKLNERLEEQVGDMEDRIFELEKEVEA
jgi:hypothetical protein